MKKRTAANVPADILPAPPSGLQVTLGSNVDAKRVALIFGDPLAEPPQFITLEPEQARQLARAMLVEADKAEGKGVPK